MGSFHTRLVVRFMIFTASVRNILGRREEVAAIPPTMLQRMMQNFQNQLRECVDNNGRHITDTIFKK
jgi:hypothetical protein